MSNRGINADEHKILLEQPLNLLPYGTEFKEHRVVQGLIIPPDGNKQMVITPVSGLVFGLWRKQLNAGVFQIEGDMVFKPDESTYKEFVREQGKGLRRVQ